MIKIRKKIIEIIKFKSNTKISEKILQNFFPGLLYILIPILYSESPLHSGHFNEILYIIFNNKHNLWSLCISYFISINYKER